MQIGTFSIRRSNRRHRARSYTTRPPGRATNKVRSENRSVEGVPSVTTYNLRFAKRGDLLRVSCKVGLIGPGRRFATKRNPTTAPFHCGMPLATRRAVARRRILCRRHQSVVQRLRCPTGPGELRSPPADFAHQRIETVNRLAPGAGIRIQQRFADRSRLYQLCTGRLAVRKRAPTGPGSGVESNQPRCGIGVAATPIHPRPGRREPRRRH